MDESTKQMKIRLERVTTRTTGSSDPNSSEWNVDVDMCGLWLSLFCAWACLPAPFLEPEGIPIFKCDSVRELNVDLELEEFGID